MFIGLFFDIYRSLRYTSKFFDIQLYRSLFQGFYEIHWSLLRSAGFPHIVSSDASQIGLAPWFLFQGSFEIHWSLLRHSAPVYPRIFTSDASQVCLVSRNFFLLCISRYLFVFGYVPLFFMFELLRYIAFWVSFLGYFARVLSMYKQSPISPRAICLLRNIEVFVYRVFLYAWVL